MQKSWIKKAIEWKATPIDLRTPKTQGEFCKLNNVPISTFKWEMAKEENQKEIIKACLYTAKKHAPDVLANISQRAKSSSNSRWAELYIKYVLELVERLSNDLTSNGQPLDMKLEIRRVNNKDS